MKVVITGGTGFIGMLLARRILEIGRLSGPSGKAEPVEELLLFDVAEPPALPAWFDQRVGVVTGEIADRDTVFRLIDRDDVGVFHLASVVSGGGEQDFDLAMRVNLQGNLNLLEALRRNRAGCHCRSVGDHLLSAECLHLRRRCFRHWTARLSLASG